LIIKVKIQLIGVSNQDFPNNFEYVEGNQFTVQQVLFRVIDRQNNSLADILFKDGNLKKEFSVLLNGTNVVSLPDKYQTILSDGDEIIITIQITGG